MNQDRRRARARDLPTWKGRITNQDVAIYDLAGLVDAADTELEDLLSSGVPVVALQPAGRHDLAGRAWRLGVADVVPMAIDSHMLLLILELAAAGGLVDEVEAHVAHREKIRLEYALTDRELDILELIGAGLRNTEVCDHLYLSINTVKSYVRSSYRKIGAKSRSQAVLWAAEHVPLKRGMNQTVLLKATLSGQP